MSITKRLSQKLRQQGYTVLETRTTDEYVDLRERQLEPNREKADIYISVHHNASGTIGGQQGILTLFHDNSVAVEGYPTLPHHDANKLAENRRLAQIVQDGMVAAARTVYSDAQSQGIRAQNLHVTRTTDMPSILVELGFMDHQKELRRLLEPRYQDALITGIFNGVNNYFGRK